jgi:hypothetical protein
MGYKLVELGLGDKPSKESLIKAYEALKTDGMIFPKQEATQEETQDNQQITTKTVQAQEQSPDKKVSVKKKATGSSVFGSTGGYGTKQTSANTNQVLLSEAEAAKMSPQQLQNWYNEQVKKQGYQQ